VKGASSSEAEAISQFELNFMLAKPFSVAAVATAAAVASANAPTCLHANTVNGPHVCMLHAYIWTGKCMFLQHLRAVARARGLR